MGSNWSRERLLELSNAFMANCILGAAAELGVFDLVADRPLCSSEIADRLGASLRGTQILLDALVALELLDKGREGYRLVEGLKPFLTVGGSETVVPMLRHRMNIARGWTMLPWTVKGGIPAPRPASIGGPQADLEAFVGAMHVVSWPVADNLVAQLQPLNFRCLLDIGGATGTWTEAFLRQQPQATAILVDLPAVVELARRRLAGSAVRDRIRLVAADYLADPLPGPADFAWVSAICHQHSREENRAVFAKIWAVLEPGGIIAIRDVVMEADRTRPMLGALFAINMLVATPHGSTYTFEEYTEDLLSAGFAEPRWAIRREDMNSVILAHKPEEAARVD